MPSTVVYVRKTGTGGSIYGTFAAAIAATSSGTGAGDRSEIRPLDSETYAEALDFGILEWVDVIADGVSPVVQPALSATPVVASGLGSNNLRFLATNGAAPKLRLNPSASSVPVFAPAVGCSLTVSGWDYESGSAVHSSYLALATGAAGDTWTFENVTCLGGLFPNPIRSTSLGNLILTDCDLRGEGASGPVVLSNTAVLTATRLRSRGSSIIAMITGGGASVAGHTLDLCIHDHNGAAEPALDFGRGPGGTGNPTAVIRRCTLRGTKAAGSIGVRNDYTASNGLDVKGLVVKGFATAYQGTKAWSPTYGLIDDCTNAYGGLATPGAGMVAGSAMFVDEVAGNYDLQSGSDAIDIVTVPTGLTTDYLGRTVPSGAAEDAGAYEYQFIPPRLLSAVNRHRNRIAVAFDSAMDTTTLGAAAWTLTAEDHEGAAPVIDSVTFEVAIDGTTVAILWLDTDMQAGAKYTVEVDALAESAAGVAMDPAYLDAAFRLPWTTGTVTLACGGAAGTEAQVRLLEVHPQTVERTEV